VASEQGDRWVSDEQLWAQAGEDPTMYVKLLRERGELSPPHERSATINLPNLPAELPSPFRSMP
jgi:hypothetical protein